MGRERERHSWLWIRFKNFSALFFPFLCSYTSILHTLSIHFRPLKDCFIQCVEEGRENSSLLLLLLVTLFPAFQSIFVLRIHSSFYPLFYSSSSHSSSSSLFPSLLYHPSTICVNLSLTLYFISLSFYSFNSIPYVTNVHHLEHFKMKGRKASSTLSSFPCSQSFSTFLIKGKVKERLLSITAYNNFFIR